jgi:hypothetical protein
MSKIFRPWKIDEPQYFCLQPYRTLWPRTIVARFVVCLVSEGLDLTEITASLCATAIPRQPKIAVKVVAQG